MDGKRLIEKIRLRNILSFGDKGEEIELLPLNVIIGQNASGKSNLVDVIKLLRSLPQEKGLIKFISSNGGIFEWIWKGKPNSELPNEMKEFSRRLKDLGGSFEIDTKFVLRNEKINYGLSVLELAQRPSISKEKIEFVSNRVVLDEDNNILERNDSINFEESLLSPIVKVDKKAFERQELRLNLFSIRAYTELQTNRSAEIRKQQPADAVNDFLEEDGSNLSLVLSSLQLKGNTKENIVGLLQRFYPKIKEYLVIPSGGFVQLFIKEEGLDKPISAMRLSDGTLRYLCLLAILCHPEPPPLICIEEPETGLHPDILPTIAELMIEASQRTQLIVTTHSDILVSALSDIPEAVLVCEKDDDGTHFKRLNEEELKAWMEEYNDLGEIWLRGGIGGTRW